MRLFILAPLGFFTLAASRTPLAGFPSPHLPPWRFVSRGGADAHTDTVRVIDTEVELDRLIAQSDTALVVLRLRGDGATEPEIVDASGEAFHRLALARASSSAFVFAVISSATESLVASRFGVQSGVTTILCLRNGAVRRQISAVAAIDVSRMSKILDSVASVDQMDRSPSESCGS